MYSYSHKKAGIKFIVSIACMVLLGTIRSIAQPLVANAGPDQTICSGGGIAIGGSPSAQFGTGPYTYSWSPATGLSSTTVANPTASPTSTLTYTLTVTDGVLATAGDAVTVNVNPSPTITVNSPTICAGGTATLTTSVSPAGGAYIWNPGGATTSNFMVSPASTTTYTCNYTYGGCTTSAVGTVTVNPLPSASVPSSFSICSGSSTASTTFVSSPPGATFTWTNSNPSIGLSAAGAGNISSFTTTNGGTTPITATISVTATLAGCTGSPSVYTITVNPQPNTNPSPSSQTICSGIVATTNLTSGVSGCSFAWTASGSGCTGFSGGSGSTINQALTNPGTVAGAASYTATATSPAGCVGPGALITVNVNPIPTATSSPGSQTICSGNSAPISWSSNVAGTTFSWTSSSTNASGATASGTTTSVSDVLTATTSSAGTVVYLVTPVAGGCTGTATFPFVTVNPPPDATFTYTSPACQNLGNLFPTFGPGATAGTFSSVGAPGLVFANTATGEIDMTASAPGSGYSITNFIPAAGGCPATSWNMGFQIEPYMDPTITNVGPVCEQASSVFNMTAATSGGTWSGSGITNSTLGTFDPFVAGPGTHIITYHSSGPCSPFYMDTALVTVVPAAPTVSAGPDHFNCAGSSITFSNITGGIATYLWDFDDGATSTVATTSHIFSAAGTYHVSFTGINSNGCVSNTDTAMVYIYANPTIPTFNTVGVCPGSCDGSASITVTGGTPSYSYFWAGTTTVNNDTVTALCAGNYTVTVTDANMCTATSILTVSNAAYADIYGHVTHSGGALSAGTNTAVLFQHMSSFASFDTVQVVSVNAVGDFLFSAVPPDDYLIKVFGDTMVYPLIVPTYYGDVYLWDSAMVKTHACLVNDTVNIVMVEGVVGVGPGMLSGHVEEGNGFVRIPGEPIPGIDVKLGRNPGGQMITNTQTDASGNYSFTGIPVNGPSDWYTIYIDIPGLERDSTYNVTVTASSFTFTNLDYEADTNSVYPIYPVSVSVASAEQNVQDFIVYPNPTNRPSTVSYTLTKNSNVQLDVYDVLGKKVESILNTNQQTGTHKVMLGKLNAGIYFVNLNVNDHFNCIRLVVTD